MNDLISRQAAIAIADDLKDDLPDDDRMANAVMAHNEGIAEYQTALSLLPSAQPEPKKGKWTEKKVIHFDDLEAKDIIAEWQSAKCDVCGKYHTTPYLYYFSDYDYCPNCGADMRGEQDAEMR